jgi:hypothetical protein
MDCLLSKHTAAGRGVVFVDGFEKLDAILARCAHGCDNKRDVEAFQTIGVSSCGLHKKELG